MRSERLTVVANEPIGPYQLVRLRRSGLDPGTPGQFFMLEAPGRVLPRPFSLCLAAQGELGFLVDPIGRGTRAIAALEPRDVIRVTGPLGNGFDLSVARPLLVSARSLDGFGSKAASVQIARAFRRDAWRSSVAARTPSFQRSVVAIFMMRAASLTSSAGRLWLRCSAFLLKNDSR